MSQRDGIEANPAKPRARSYWFVLLILVAVAALYFSYLRDCFFSVPIYDSLFWAIPCLLFLSSTPWFIVAIRKLRDRQYVIVDKHGVGSRSVIHSVSTAFFIALIAGFALLPSIGVGALGAVYVSSTDAVHFSAAIGIRKGGTGSRRCSWFLTFYNRPIGREVMICADYRGIGGVKSGDVLNFEEKTGPMGARLIGIQRKLN